MIEQNGGHVVARRDKALIALCREEVNFFSSGLSSLPSLSSRLKIIHGGNNHGGCFQLQIVGLPCLFLFFKFYISANVNRNIIEQHGMENDSLDYTSVEYN